VSAIGLQVGDLRVARPVPLTNAVMSSKDKQSVKTNWRKAPMASSFLAIDFETANCYRDSACAVGLVRVEEGKITQQVVHLIRPPYRDFRFTSIHGISWSDVAEAPTFVELWPRIAPLFEGVEVLAAHNASFDRSVLRACCEAAGIEVPKLDFTCTMKLARAQWNLRPTKLSDVARHLDIELDHHEALSDALACAKIMLAIRHESGAPKTATPNSIQEVLTPVGRVLVRRGQSTRHVPG
jgi:DNA polymerase-3 subunit epsilon